MKYEMMYILDPSLSEDDQKKTSGDIKSLLEANGATVTKEDVWGTKKMAYRIKNSAEGFYVLLDVEMDWKAIKTISKDLNLEENIWRYMFVKNED